MERRKATYILASGLVLLLCLLVALGTATGSPDTFTVNTTYDTDDTTCDASHCSLREAINAANNNAGSDTIAFNIPITDPGYEVSGITGTWTITLINSLPYLSGGGTVISGTTQAAFIGGDPNPGGPEIEINGNSKGCFVLWSDNNVIHGLVINWCQAGVFIYGASNNTVSGNYIGTDALGSSGLGNLYGVWIAEGAQNNIIGGDTPGERNLISGNQDGGVHIEGNGNTVSGNYIGTDVSGSSALHNYHGVYISGGQDNVIGGTTPGERNVISGNDSRGVFIGGNGNTISGNYIGTDASGTQDLGNDCGIYIYASDNIIGGDTPGERNVISGNVEGVYIYRGAGNTISGNYIGTDASGSSALGNYYGISVQGVTAMSYNNVIGGDTLEKKNVISGNYFGVLIRGSWARGNSVSGNYIGIDASGSSPLGDSWGIYIRDGAQNNVIGGDTPGERNIISGNDWEGVTIYGSGTSGNIISGNYIGTDAFGTSDLGNGSLGVSIYGGAQNNLIGGDSPGERNVISGNDYAGVFIYGSGTDGNTITQNSIYYNAGLGIALIDGANGNIPAPTIGAANACFVAGTAGAGHTVEIFTGPDEEGKTCLTTVSADGYGKWSASGPFTLDTYVTATATDGNGNTSEFSTVVTPGTCYQIFLPLIMKNY